MLLASSRLLFTFAYAHAVSLLFEFNGSILNVSPLNSDGVELIHMDPINHIMGALALPS